MSARRVANRFDEDFNRVVLILVLLFFAEVRLLDMFPYQLSS